IPMVLRHPFGLQHDRRPPLARQRIGHVRCRLCQADELVLPPGSGEVTDIGVSGRDGGHPDRAGPDHRVSFHGHLSSYPRRPAAGTFGGMTAGDIIDGRTRHYGTFYGLDPVRLTPDRPLLLVWGN